MCRESIHCKGFIHMVTEAAGWKQEEPLPKFRSKVHLLQDLLSLGDVSLWVSSGLRLIGRGPPSLWRAICFTQRPLV